jgi:hypothetical protein
MDAKGAEALRKYLEAHHGGQIPDATPCIEGTGVASLERWFKVRDEQTDPRAAGDTQGEPAPGTAESGSVPNQLRAFPRAG